MTSVFNSPVWHLGSAAPPPPGALLRKAVRLYGTAVPVYVDCSPNVRTLYIKKPKGRRGISESCIAYSTVLESMAMGSAH